MSLCMFVFYCARRKRFLEGCGNDGARWKSFYCFKGLVNEANARSSYMCVCVCVYIYIYIYIE